MQFVEKFRLVDNFKKVRTISNQAFTDFPSLVRQWQKNLGQFIFILLGRLDENQILERRTKGSKHLERIVFDPTLSKKVGLNGKTLTIRDLTDEELALKELKKRLSPPSNSQETDWDTTSSAVRDASASLHNQRSISLHIPQNETITTPVFIEKAKASLERHLQMYDGALKKWLENDDVPERLNELLRTSYAFAGEAIKFVKLLVSISGGNTARDYQAGRFDGQRIFEPVKNLSEEARCSLSEYCSVLRCWPLLQLPRSKPSPCARAE